MQARLWLLLPALVIVLAIVVYLRRADIHALWVGDPALPPGSVAADLSAIQPVAEGFRPQVVIPKPFPPIQNVPVATAEEVSAPDAARTVQDNELVLGVMVGEEARAYPINMLTGPSREIINDMLGGVPIAATW